MRAKGLKIEEVKPTYPCPVLPYERVLYSYSYAVLDARLWLEG